MLLETLLQKHSAPHEITQVFHRKHIVFFKLHGESFCSVASSIYHSSSPMFDHPILRIRAEEAHDPDRIAELEAENKDLDAEDALWNKHKATTLKHLMSMALSLQKMHGDEVMIDFVEKHFDLMPTGAMQYVRKLESEE